MGAEEGTVKVKVFTGVVQGSAKVPTMRDVE